jgi:hypothetical protein
MAFRLRGSYAPTDAQTAGPTGLEVVVIDIPMPHHTTVNHPPLEEFG